MNPLRTIFGWLENRLQFKDSIKPIMDHPVPKEVGGRKGWAYVFGSVTTTFFVLQIVSGICLAMVYEPTVEGAYASLEYLNYEVPFGWLMRAIHYWSGSAMVLMMFVHLAQVFLWGAFKYPREITWLAGVGLLLLTLGLAFTGQVLRFDADAYWGIGVGVSAAARVPAAGSAATHMLMGGEFIGTNTISRFFTLHVFVLPALLIGVLTLHVYMVLKRGISEPPTPGKLIDPASYDNEYHELVKDGVPFVPDVLYRDGIACGVSVIIVIALSVWLGPKGPEAIGDPTLLQAEPRPDWAFLPIYALASLAPPSMETALMLGLPVIGILVLLSVPFVSGVGEKSWRRRPVSVITVVISVVAFLILGWYGATAPWSPQMDAWSGEPVPVRLVARLTPLERQGAAVFQSNACRNCHALDGLGGRRGPDLTDVGRRMNYDRLVRQVIQGGGNMPAYGQRLDSAEVEAMVAFLVAMRPEGDPPARVPAAPAILERGEQEDTAAKQGSQSDTSLAAVK
ncbi:MAG: cytochrome b N-terminal domain-containing protein [Planctomycetaceae bacterium]